MRWHNYFPSETWVWSLWRVRIVLLADFFFFYCTGIIKNTRTVMGCLHRFCKECIDKHIRMGYIVFVNSYFIWCSLANLVDMSRFLISKWRYFICRNNECPTCKEHCASRRSLRDDVVFDSIISAVYSDVKICENKVNSNHILNFFWFSICCFFFFFSFSWNSSLGIGSKQKRKIV